MGSSSALLSIAIAALCRVAVLAQQQGGVSWETAPECPDSGTGTAVDTQGRTWGWSNGQSCKYSRGAQYIPSNAAQQQSWDNAPPCAQAPTPDNSRVDSLGRSWGWQDGRSCKYTASSSTIITSSPVPVVTWDTASPCGYPATAANSAPDALGRYWGWQNGRSCRFDQPPPKPPSPSPLLVPRSSPKLPPAAAPKQPKQQLPARPEPQASPTLKPEPPARPKEEPAAVDTIPTQPSPEPAPAKAPAKPSPRPVPTKTQPQPEPEPQETPETPAVPSPKPKGTVVLSSDLEPSPEPQPSPSPSPEPGPLPDITIRVVKESPSPSPNSEDKGLVTITPGVGLPSPSPSPAVADEAGTKQGTADAAAATAAAVAAAEAINSTGVVDAPQNFTAPPAEAPVASDRAAQQQTDLVLGYQGVPLSEFQEQYAAGSLAAVSQVAGVPEADVTQTLGSAPGASAASAAAAPAPEPTAAAAAPTAAPAAAPAAAPISQQGSSGNSSSGDNTPAVAAESGLNSAAAAGANTSAPAAAQDGTAATAAAPAATPAAASAPDGNTTATPAAAGTGSRKLLRSARNLHSHPQQLQQHAVAPQQLLLGGTVWQLRRLQGVGGNTYAIYAITSPSSSKTARKVSNAAKDGTLYQQLQQNGVPFIPSVSLDGNMLQKGQPGRVTSRTPQKGLGAGAVAGIVIGSIVGVGLLAGLALLCCLCCTRKKKAPKDSSKAAAVAKAKADLAKSKGAGNNGAAKRSGPGNGSSPSPVPTREQAKAPAVPVRKPKNLMDRFATWSAPADAHATAPGAATAPDKPLLTKPGAAAAGAGGVAAGAAAAAAGRSDEHSSTGRHSQHIRLRDKYAVSQGDEDDDTFYYQDSRPKRYSDSGSRRSRNAGDEDGLLDGVPSLSSRSSLSQGVNRERGLVTSKIGIAGNPKFVTGKGQKHHGHDGHHDKAPRPMSIKERVERDRQLEAAAGGAPSDLHSAAGDTSESSWNTSAYTYNSMEPMEKSELAAAAMALQSRRSSGATAAVTGASHIQQIHIGGRRSPVPGGQSPRVSPLPGRSPQSSPHPGRSPRNSPPRERLPPSKPGATADVAVVVPHVARSIQSSATGSVSGKSAEVPAAPPANVGTSVGGNGWLWGNSPGKK